MAVETPYLLQAIIYTAASYRYFFGCRDHVTNFTRLTAYHETLRGLREIVHRAGSASANNGCSDAILLAIALLTIHGPPSDMQGRTLLGEQQLKDYEYYGSKVWAPSHLQALLSLVKQRGGLQRIGIQSLSGIIFTYVQTPLLAFTCRVIRQAGLILRESIDTTNAASVLEKPTFALPFPPAHFLKVLRQQRQTVKQTSSRQEQQPEQPRRVCRGFRFLLKSFPKCGRALLPIVEDVHELVDTYVTLLHGQGCGVDFGQLVATWRILQHQALSLDPAPAPVPARGDSKAEAEAEDLLLYQLCRVAVVIYLTECLEPLPTIGAFHENCSRRLMLLIDECDKLGYWQRHHHRQKSPLGAAPELLLWATVLGGFTARGTTWLRQWYVEQLRSGSPIPTDPSRWDDVLAVSEKYLPFRHRQAQGCREFWDAACIYLAATRIPS